jgi:hypothetical protein
MTRMSFTAAEGRRQVLQDIAAATEQLALALAALGEAYEQLDEHAGERLESELFRPLQVAYARAQRTYGEFARRSGLPGKEFAPAGPGLPERPGVELARAGDQLELADATLAALQDSMLPVEVGDRELRAGIAEVRRLIAPLPGRARALTRTLGR